MAGGTVAFEVPAEVAFDYLADPSHRPEWQSSLARISHVEGEVGVGQRWVDETRPGLKPDMRTTEYERPRRWSEAGTWRFVRAELTLTFSPTGVGCEVRYQFRIRALGPLGLAASWVSVPAVGADLRRAARLLARRAR
jgi:uncharacterized protein YndB with AHSA1/START domain